MYKILHIELDKNPVILTRAVLPKDDKKEIKDKNSKQFVNLFDVSLTISVKNRDEIFDFSIPANKGYVFDGATIPFNIGKGNMKLLIPALFHDITCERKELVFYERKLSSLIFKALLLECKVPFIKAVLMYYAVDNYQKFCPDWNYT